MAGAGYKLFNTGDVLTAAQVNTYLNEQTVMVFASSAARTSALSGVLAEGMMSYLQDTNSVEVYNGTAWVSVGGGGGDVTEVQAGVGISVASGTGPIPIITNSSTDLITTAGDLLYGTAADTVARLGIGTAGQVLKVNSGATAPEWGAAATGSKGYTLINSGGTALTGAQTITVSSISGYDSLLILIVEASSASASSFIGVRFNADSGSNYGRAGMQNTAASTYAANNFSQGGSLTQSSLDLAKMSTNAASVVSASLIVTGANTALIKGLTAFGSADAGGGNSQVQYVYNGFWNNSSTISSVSAISSIGNFDNGTLYIYGAV